MPARSARERVTLMRIFEDLRELGYEGGYDAVRRYATSWRRHESSGVGAAFVPLSFDPGEAYQFDWSHEIVLIGGTTVTIRQAHMRLCHSRLPRSRGRAACRLFEPICARRKRKVFDAHDRAFVFFKGACTKGIYDNMKTAVDAIFVGKAATLRRGKERAYNRRFAQMCSHYLVEPVACTPASGWEKGQVGDTQVGTVRQNFFAPRVRVKSLEELNDWLADRCVAWAKSRPHPEIQGKTIWQVFEEERASLVPYGGRFDGFHAIPASVSKTCLVRFDNNKVAGQGECGRAASGDPRLRRQDRAAPGRTDRRRACPCLWARRDRLQSLALRSSAGAQTWSFAQWRALQALGAAGSNRTSAPLSARSIRR